MASRLVIGWRTDVCCRHAARRSFHAEPNGEFGSAPSGISILISPSLTRKGLYSAESRSFFSDVHQDLDWSHINDEMILHYVPTKTAKKTASQSPIHEGAPMVMEELEPLLKEGQPTSGAVVQYLGRRYTKKEFAHLFRKDATVAGIGKDVWSRDLRASGITEAREYGGAIDDVQKMAGHATNTTTKTIYAPGLLLLPLNELQRSAWKN